MPFALLKLPIIIQFKILKSMKLSDLFLATFFIKELQRLTPNVYYKTKLVTYIALGLENNLISIRPNRENDFQIVKWEGNDEEEMKVGTIYGQKIKYRITFSDYDIPTIHVPREKHVWILHKIQLHTQKLFKTAEDVKLHYFGEHIDQVQLAFPLRTITFYGNRHLAKDLDTFLDNNSVGQRVVIDSQTDGKLKENSKLWKLDEVCTMNATCIRSDNFEKFEGRHLFCYKSHFKNQDVIDFIKRWKKGESNTRLEVMILSHTNFNQDVLLRDFDAKAFDSKRRSAVYVSKDYHIRQRETVWDCSQSLDIFRDTDQMLASVRVFRNQFLFFVWNDRFPVTHN